MISRFAGGILGLLAFAVAATMGLAVGNPPMAVLTRAIWALVIFCIVGLAVGAAAQAVINDYVAKQEEKLRSPAGERTSPGGAVEAAVERGGEAAVTD